MKRSDTKRYWKHGFVQIVLLVMLVGVAPGALNVDYLGSVRESLYAPTSLEVYGEGLAVLEPFTSDIKLFTPEGVITKSLHLEGEAYGLTYVDNNRFMFCDRERKALILVDLDTDAEEVVAVSSGLFVDPVDLVRQDEYLYVLDAGQSAVVKLGLDGSVKQNIPLTDPDGQSLTYASSFCYDPQHDRFYVLDQINSRICVVSGDGLTVSSFGSFGRNDGQLTRGGEIARSGDGRIFVTDRFQGRIMVFSADGVPVGTIGQATGEEPGMAIPTGITIDENGILYVASTMTPSIRIYHVVLSPEVYRLAEAQPEFPPDGAELEADSITMIARADPVENGIEVTGFDFQLFTEADPSEPLAEIYGVNAGLVESGSPDNQRLIASWSPEIDLAGDAVYNWRTRTRGKDTSGEWSQLQSFRVSSLPREFRLDQNYPNPFNPETRISFSLPRQSNVSLEVFSLLGRRVIKLYEGVLAAGNHTVAWNGNDESSSPVATGVYFYRLRADDFVQTKKMVLLK